MAAKHTAGPWTADVERGRVLCPRAQVAAEIADPDTGEPSEANTRLIAAAPEMYEALRDCVRALEGWTHLNGDGTDVAVIRARAALARAEGR
jgi:hypothetical protein